MTQNQVAYLNYAENKRNNIVVSQETNRHNLATEGETNRHNIVTERQEDTKIAETGRHNLVTEQETGRHNLVTEQETGRHNLVTESQTQAANSEIARHNRATERATRKDQRELHRHNLASEKQQRYNTDKQTSASRYNTDKQTAASIYSTQVGAQTASKRMATDKAMNSARLDLEQIKNIRDNKTKVRVSEITAKSNKYIKTIDQVMQDKRLSQEQIFRQKELKKEYAKIMADLARTEGNITAAGLDALTKVMNGMLNNASGSRKK